MQVLRARLDGDPAPRTLPRGGAVAIGNFDGVHVGHQALLTLAHERARALGAPTVALTFDPHPATVVAAEGPPPLLTTFDRKLELLDAAGVDVCVVVAFTPQLAATDPAVFADAALADLLGAREVVVGSAFRFGQGRRGDVDTLRAAGGRHGVTVHAVEPVLVDGEVASSSRIRGLIAAGDVAAAARVLGRAYDVDGDVVRGAGRGRTIGIPTANVATPEGTLLPAIGVYAGWTEGLEPKTPRRAAAINLGKVPTFGGDRLTLEAHVLDYEGDLYGTRVRVAFAERLRGEAKFPDVDALVAQIRRDVDATRALFEARR